MIQTTVTIDTREVLATLDSIRAALVDKEALHGAMAEGVADVTRQHLTEKYLPKDEDGLDFWADVLRSVEATADDSGANVTLEQLGLRLRYRGGTVTPGKSISSYTGKLTRALAIPTRRVGVENGRRKPPALSGLLAFVRGGRGSDVIGYLFEGTQQGTISRGRNKGKPRIVESGTLLYTLKLKQTTQADPDILPADDILTSAAVDAIAALILGGDE
jgi:hypothetical protein